jgi:lipoic acid synthetase
MMLGLGETQAQVHEALHDLKDAGCEIVTLGQYLQPDQRKLLVKEFITPEAFADYAAFGHSIGIRYVYAGPFVRSSYNAKEVFMELQ